MRLEIVAKSFEILAVNNEIDVVVPWYEAAMTQGSENVATVETASHTNLAGSGLQVDGHVEEAELGASARGTVGVVFSAEHFFGLACVVCLVFFHVSFKTVFQFSLAMSGK